MTRLGTKSKLKRTSSGQTGIAHRQKKQPIEATMRLHEQVFGTKIMGVGGMLLGVPLAAAAYRILRDDVNSRLAEPETEN